MHGRLQYMGWPGGLFRQCTRPGGPLAGWADKRRKLREGGRWQVRGVPRWSGLHAHYNGAASRRSERAVGSCAEARTSPC